MLPINGNKCHNVQRMVQAVWHRDSLFGTGAHRLVHGLTFDPDIAQKHVDKKDTVNKSSYLNSKILIKFSPHSKPFSDFN